MEQGFIAMRWGWLAGMALWLALPVGAARGEDSRLPEGTLLFLENCSSVVEWSTRGEIAHVALVFREEGATYVYEATPAKVRRVTLAEYELELARLNRKRDAEERIRTFALAPRTAYSDEEAAKMRDYLRRQLGRRYSVKNYVRGKPYDGIHCAELASSTLNESGRYGFEDCHRFNPRTFYAAVARSHDQPRVMESELALDAERWTVRARRWTAGWFTWCGWGCKEAWLFLW